MKKLIKYLGVLVIALIASTGVTNAQQVISGTVMDNSNIPVIGASILVKGTSIGTLSDIDGSYSISVPDGSTELEISYLGFGTQTVNIADGTYGTIIMQESSNFLDEVVVTGLATTIKRSNLANAVASISAKELTGVTPQNTIDGALYGKFKGADIRANSGAPGGGFSIRLRGVTSVFLNQQPQYIIDGVYLDNSSISLGTDIVTAAAGGGNTSTNQDDASNRIADLIPEDIESIEILKGASAAAIYGVGGAGGVVVIKTKSGNYNQAAKINFSQTIGFSSPTNLLGDRGWDAALVEEVFGPDERALFDANGVTDYERELYDNKPLQTISSISVSGGGAKSKYFISGTYRNQGGLVDNTGYEKASLRANVSTKITDRLKFDLTSTYIFADADRGLFNNSNANTTVGYAQAFTRPWDVLQPDANGNFPANPRVGSNVLETIELTTNEERVNRFFGSGTLTYSILQRDNQTLKAGLEVGLDQYTLRTRGIFPQSLSFFRDPSSLRGASVAGTGFNNRTNISGYLVHSFFTDNNINFRTQVGAIQLNSDQNVLRIISSGLNGSQTNIDQAENSSVSQNIETEVIKGVFAQEEINYDDKVILTLGIRGDKSSNNGDPNEIFWNPKASLAVNIHELTDLGNTISQLKPRFAFGQSVRFAGFADRFNALNPGQILGNAGLFTTGLRGNPNVDPETQTEVEFGVDLGLFNNRLLLNGTFYTKTIDDLLLRAQVPASSGFTSQVVNAGELRNRGVELGLEAEVVSTDNISWATGLNWWRNRSEVTRLDIPAFNTGGFAAFLGVGRIQEGASATQLGGSIDPSTCNTPDDCTNVDPEGDGFQAFGDIEADFNLGWTNSLLIGGNIEINWLLHWKQGGDGINLSTLLYDLGAVTWDFDDTTLDPTGELSNGDFRLAALGTHPDVYIEDAGYLRLREIGAYYTIPGENISWAENIRFGISGRNLINLFGYNSYDPEVSNFGNNVLINSVEVTPYPASRNVNLHLNVTF